MDLSQTVQAVDGRNLVCTTMQPCIELDSCRTNSSEIAFSTQKLEPTEKEAIPTENQIRKPTTNKANNNLTPEIGLLLRQHNNNKYGNNKYGNNKYGRQSQIRSPFLNPSLFPLSLCLLPFILYTFARLSVCWSVASYSPPCLD